MNNSDIATAVGSIPKSPALYLLCRFARRWSDYPLLLCGSTVRASVIGSALPERSTPEAVGHYFFVVHRLSLFFIFILPLCARRFYFLLYGTPAFDLTF